MACVYPALDADVTKHRTVRTAYTALRVDVHGG